MQKYSSFFEDNLGWILKIGGALVGIILFLFTILPKSKFMNMMWMIAASYTPGQPDPITTKVYIIVTIFSLFIGVIVATIIHFIHKHIDD